MRRGVGIQKGCPTSNSLFSERGVQTFSPRQTVHNSRGMGVEETSGWRHCELCRWGSWHSTSSSGISTRVEWKSALGDTC